MPWKIIRDKGQDTLSPTHVNDEVVTVNLGLPIEQLSAQDIEDMKYAFD